MPQNAKTVLDILGRNPIHPFPARMAPEVALEALGESKTPLRVLDPMAGSGTVLAVARSKGHRVVGVDLDPFAVLLAGVWTRTVDAERVNNKAVEVLRRAKSGFDKTPVREAYPSASDDETRKFIRYWFDGYARRQLTALSTAISRVRHEATRDVLWCGFSRLIITKSAGASRAMDLSHSRPHRTFDYAPVKPFDRFISAVELIVANCPQSGREPVGPVTLVKQGDARALDLGDRSIDLVLTSPPYLNAIDYMRCSKFSLVWMGHNVSDLRQIRANSVGTEASTATALEAEWVKVLIKQLALRPALGSRDEALLAQYVFDMGKAIDEVSRVLRRGGRAVYVVGDSTIRGTFVKNSAIIEGVAEGRGLKLSSKKCRALPANRRYLPPPRRDQFAAMNSRMRREVVLVFEKVRA